jgi:L-asparaginase II
VAIKLEAGDQTAIPAVALTVVERLGWLGEAAREDAGLAPYRRSVLRNWQGIEVGEVTVASGWTEGLVR